jgi:transposase
LPSGSTSDLLIDMEPHPIELRVRVVETYEAGEGSYATIAERFAIGEASVKRWVWLKRAAGNVRPQPKRGGTPSRIAGAELDELIVALGDPTAGELTAAYNRQRRGRSRVHVSSMKRALHRHGYVVKKNVDGHWRVSGRTSSPSAPRL